MAASSFEMSLKQAWGEKTHAACGNSRFREYKKFIAGYAGMTAGWSTPPPEIEVQARDARKPEVSPIVMTAGKPDPNCLPYEDLLEFAQKAWEVSKPAPLEYGASDLLKSEIAKYLTRSRGRLVEPAEVFITSGNSGGLKNVMESYLGPGDLAIVESPLWTYTVNLMKLAGAEVINVGQDKEGISVDEIEQQMSAAERSGKRIKMIYTQPVNHNPTGTTISKMRAERLLQVAASHGAVIVSDEPYEMYCYREQPCFLSAMSGGHGVLTVHTFSKTLGTGLRLGYVQAQPEWLEPLQKCSNINGSIFWEYAVGEVMASGRFEQIVSRSKEIYARKIKIFCEALEAHVGRHLACPPAQSGGFFVWIELASLPADEVNLQMINMGVEARLGRIMYGPDHDERSSRDGKPKCCHIGFAFIGPSEKELVEAAKRVGAACQAVEDGKLWRPGPAARL